jgi:hypothetical protein
MNCLRNEVLVMERENFLPMHDSSDRLRLVRNHLQFGLYFDATIVGEEIIASKDSKQYRIVPKLSTEELSMEELHRLGNVVLAIVSPDSSIVYYKSFADPILDFQHPT